MTFGWTTIRNNVVRHYEVSLIRPCDDSVKWLSAFFFGKTTIRQNCISAKRRFDEWRSGKSFYARNFVAREFGVLRVVDNVIIETAGWKAIPKRMKDRREKEEKKASELENCSVQRNSREGERKRERKIKMSVWKIEKGPGLNKWSVISRISALLRNGGRALAVAPPLEGGVNAREPLDAVFPPFLSRHTYIRSLTRN